jgi:hypothetical protein
MKLPQHSIKNHKYWLNKKYKCSAKSRMNGWVSSVVFDVQLGL